MFLPVSESATAARVKAFQCVRGERSGALNLQRLVGRTADTQAKKNFSLENIQCPGHGISDPERFVSQTSYRLRRLFLLPAGLAAHLRVELLLPVLPWSGTLSVSLNRNANGNAH